MKCNATVEYVIILFFDRVCATVCFILFNIWFHYRINCLMIPSNS